MENKYIINDNETEHKLFVGENGELVIPKIFNLENIDFLEVRGKVLSEASQKQLGLKFASLEVNVEFDDYCFKSFNYETLEVDFHEVITNIQQLRNSSDDYVVNVFLKYEILNEDMKLFKIDYNSHFKRLTEAEEKAEEKNIYIDLFYFRIANAQKPLENLLYDEAYYNMQNIQDVNGCFHIDSIDATIASLNKLKSHLSKK